MSYQRPCRESGDKFSLQVEGLGYSVDLPWVWLPADPGLVRIASLDLVGQTRLNDDLGRLLAAKLAPLVAGKPRVGMLTAVEKGLQLAQVIDREISERWCHARVGWCGSPWGSQAHCAAGACIRPWWSGG